MDDEPLSAWADRRDARIGRLRAVPLIPGDGPRAGHLAPEAPRLIQRWNGYTWEAYGFAADLAEAKRVLYPAAQEPPVQAPGQAPNPLRAGTGRHRKPPAAAAGPE
ncbi:DUF6087 family protein [Streptomyces sp. LP11]|uniref:DUF6087 family protein n=1 Tax=Streptomyces pyxinicus TaxID=2970331 RepID=A0ABT2B9Y3_9ACTN|nr:DUF6087 family protein [Streptomyces sp. LP11]MCS0605320.1 DUF6087 family protein [Streptomyces sp. LP11]